MECGCAPGSWSQVSSRLVNAKGVYDKHQMEGFHVGCDLNPVDSVPGAVLLPKQDFTTEDTQKIILKIIGSKDLNVVISDMAPNASGHKSLDHERIMGDGLLRLLVSRSKKLTTQNG